MEITIFEYLFMGKSTINGHFFNSFLYVYQRVNDTK